MMMEGTWAKVADKRYRHENGIEVAYDHNRWGWYLSTDAGRTFRTLGAAQRWAERG